MNTEKLNESLLLAAEKQQKHSEIESQWNGLLPKFYELYELAGVKRRRFVPVSWEWPKLTVNFGSHKTDQSGAGTMFADLHSWRTPGGSWEPGGHQGFTVAIYFSPDSDTKTRLAVSKEAYDSALFNSILSSYGIQRNNDKYLMTLPDQIAALDETITLLKKAIQDPELNPKFVVLQNQT